MTEQEWLTSCDPAKMLEFLRIRHEPGGYDPVSNRKLRLFAVACCRQVWDGVPCEKCWSKGGWWRCPNCHGEWAGEVGPDCFVCSHPKLDRVVCSACHCTGRVGGLTDPRSRHAVEVAEQFADGLATEEEIQTCFISSGVNYYEDTWKMDSSARWCCASKSDFTRLFGKFIKRFPGVAAIQAALLRDIVGNPWRLVKLPGGVGVQHPVWGLGIHYPWLLWNDGVILKMAQSIYDERAFDRMPILGDALEEAGCTNEDMLRHCRGPGPHARGCWVIDLLLGKE